MYQQERAVAESVARQAGTLLKKQYRKKILIDYKHDKSPVTAVDKQLDEFIKKMLKDSFPHDVVNSEESPWQSSLNKRMWLVDPIDGTENFIEQNDEFSICIALVVNEQPVVGVVYAPILDKLYVAIRGEGSWLNGNKLQVTVKRTFNQAIQVVSRHVGGEASFSEFPHRLRLGSSALRLCAIAEGLADVFFYRKTGQQSRLHVWDVAASTLILREAGGFVSDLQGNDLLFGQQPLFMKGVVASRKDFIPYLFAK